MKKSLNLKENTFFFPVEYIQNYYMLYHNNHLYIYLSCRSVSKSVKNKFSRDPLKLIGSVPRLINILTD